MGGEHRPARRLGRGDDLRLRAPTVADLLLGAEHQQVAPVGGDLVADEHQHPVAPPFVALAPGLQGVVVGEQQDLRPAARGGAGELGHARPAVGERRVDVDDAADVVVGPR